VTRTVLEGGLPPGVPRVGDDCVDISASILLRGLLRDAVVRETLFVVAPLAVDATELFANASFADGARIELHAPRLEIADGMFDNATGFSQDVSDWDVSAVISFREMFRGTHIATQTEVGTVACRIHAAWRQLAPMVWSPHAAGLAVSSETCDLGPVGPGLVLRGFGPTSTAYMYYNNRNLIRRLRFLVISWCP
jgi:hypothetical protein